MITITGLTARQKQVIDLLWNCTTLEQARALVAALPTERDRADAGSLLLMVGWDCVELEEGLDQYAAAAAHAIARAGSR